METFRTSPPATYIPPSGEEMREAAGKVGLKSFSKDLVADLCNLAAGGRTCPPSEYESEVRKRVAESLPAPDANGRWSLPKGGFTEKRQEAVNALTGKAMRYHRNVQDFLGSVDLVRFPGGSPLEQAMSLLKLLSKQSGGAGGGEGGEPLPIFADAERPEEIAEGLNDLMDEVESLSGEELDMFDPEGKAHEVPNSLEKEQDGQRSGHSGLNKLAVAEDIAPGSDRRAMLDISRTLDQFSKLQLRKQERLEMDPAGEEIHTRPIRHLGELAKINKSAWGMRQESPTYFWYSAISGQLPVRERVTRVVRKQAVFILVDGSGSMKGKRHWKATGVVMNRLKAVLSGDAEVWVSVFDTQLGKVSHAATPEEARELIKKFAAGNFTGGGTDIAAAVKSAHAFIEKAIKDGASLYRPEIVVLTDEDSSTDGVKSSQIPGTRVHGFAMEVANPKLTAFARSTGGVGIDKF